MIFGRLLCKLGLHRPFVTQHITSGGLTSFKASACRRSFCTWSHKVSRRGR